MVCTANTSITNIGRWYGHGSRRKVTALCVRTYPLSGVDSKTEDVNLSMKVEIVALEISVHRPQARVSVDEQVVCSWGEL